MSILLRGKTFYWMKYKLPLGGSLPFCNFTFLAIDCPVVVKAKSASLLAFIQELLTSLFKRSLAITVRL